MNKLSERATERAHTTSPPGERPNRDRATDDQPPEPMRPDHRAAVAEGREQIKRGEIAGAEEIEAAFRLFGP